MLAGLNLQRLTATLAPAVLAAWTGIAAAAPAPAPEGGPARAGSTKDEARQQAGSARDAAGQPAASEQKPLVSPRSQKHVLTPMMLEIRQAVEDEKAALEELYDQLARSRDAMSVMEIQGRIQTLKEKTELAILNIQLRHARLGGRADVVRQLESVIQVIQTPRQPRVPLERPLPSAGSSRPGR